MKLATPNSNKSLWLALLLVVPLTVAILDAVTQQSGHPSLIAPAVNMVAGLISGEVETPDMNDKKVEVSLDATERIDYKQEDSRHLSEEKSPPDVRQRAGSALVSVHSPRGDEAMAAQESVKGEIESPALALTGPFDDERFILALIEQERAALLTYTASGTYVVAPVDGQALVSGQFIAFDATPHWLSKRSITLPKTGLLRPLSVKLNAMLSGVEGGESPYFELRFSNAFDHELANFQQASHREAIELVWDGHGGVTLE